MREEKGKAVMREEKGKVVMPASIIRGCPGPDVADRRGRVTRVSDADVTRQRLPVAR
jgi:hypothetical protein